MSNHLASSCGLGRAPAYEPMNHFSRLGMALVGLLRSDTEGCSSFVAFLVRHLCLAGDEEEPDLQENQADRMGSRRPSRLNIPPVTRRGSVAISGTPMKLVTSMSRTTEIGNEWSHPGKVRKGRRGGAERGGRRRPGGSGTRGRTCCSRGARWRTCGSRGRAGWEGRGWERKLW